MVGYWSTTLRRRTSRRRALALFGSSLAGVSLAMACGGSDDPSGTGPQASGPSGTGTGSSPDEGLVSIGTDESAAGVPGGIFPDNHGGTPFVLDPQAIFNFTASSIVAPVYSALVKYGKAVGARPGADTITGDAMSGWEIHPDGLQVVYKLRPNHTFDPRPPTNGRAMTVEDVKYSWDRTEAVSPLGGALFRSAGPVGVVDRLETPDAETIVIHLPEPYGAVNETLAYGYFYISPVESEDQFDPRNEARGSGPFMIEKWDPDIAIDYVRNPNWYAAERPFLDGIRKLFITEAATIEAQFAARTLWSSGVRQPDYTLRTKTENPEIRMMQQPPSLAPGGYPLNLGTLFHGDVRLRRAASMMIDRDAMIEAAYNTTVYADAGLDVPLIWDGHLSSNGINWLDPKGDELGEGAQWFQYNPEEAARLLEAAGYTGQTIEFIRRPEFGPAIVGDIVANMLEEGGFKLTHRAVQENEWRELKDTGGAGYEGFLWHTANSYNDDGYLATKYTAGGRDRAAPGDIPSISDAVNQLRRELDNERRIESFRQIQRDLANEMLDVPLVSTQPTQGFILTWPWLRNTAWTVPGFNQAASSARPYVDYWVDEALRAQYGG